MCCALLVLTQYYSERMQPREIANVVQPTGGSYYSTPTHSQAKVHIDQMFLIVKHRVAL